MSLLPTIDLAGNKVTRLICGGNPQSGFSHVTPELDREMIDYYSMPNIQALLEQCEQQGLNTLQSRGDRHQMRAYLEHRQRGGKLQWIAQIASEFADLKANIATIADYGPIAIYHHGTHTDNTWHAGEIDKIHDIVKAVHDHGLPAGVASHIPEVIDHMENHDWETDFYMCCFYNLARGYKAAPAAEQDAYVRDRFPPEDPIRMTKVMRQTRKTCLGFKILAASRKCKTPETTREAFKFAFDNIKPIDAIVVGMFPKYGNQVAENAGCVRELLS